MALSFSVLAQVPTILPDSCSGNTWSCMHLLVPNLLQVETQRFNATFARKDERTPLVDFLLLAAAKGKAIYSQAYAELARQVWAVAPCCTGLPRDSKAI